MRQISLAIAACLILVCSLEAHIGMVYPIYEVPTADLPDQQGLPGGQPSRSPTQGPWPDSAVPIKLDKQRVVTIVKV